MMVFSVKGSLRSPFERLYVAITYQRNSTRLVSSKMSGCRSEICLMEIVSTSFNKLVLLPPDRMSSLEIFPRS